MSIRFALLFAALALFCEASAQPYPAKPIRFLVPYTPGGSTDIVARTVAVPLQHALGQPIVIENRPGAAEVLATELLARSEPNGYTILLISNTFAINETFVPKVPYNSERDFASVVKLVDVPFAMLVNPALSVNSVSELVAWAKSHPGKGNYAHYGIGTPHFLTMEWFKRVTGIDMVGIPYNGAVPGLTAVATGDVAVLTTGLGGALSFIKSGKVKAIASASARRLASMPELPTIAESGYSNFDLTSWFGILTRAGTPPEVVERLNLEFTRAVTAPDVKQRMASLGYESSPMSSREFGRFIRREIDNWGRIIKATGIKRE
ncbi:MAG: tripartite tricarboxylate transporter substrate binding protein [Betaproteobacteria bacterium]|nr:tripartite tricarboxylate transporter substrate binding protein [Betaproteobacteria bacterium]